MNEKFWMLVQTRGMGCHANDFITFRLAAWTNFIGLWLIAVLNYFQLMSKAKRKLLSLIIDCKRIFILVFHSSVEPLNERSKICKKYFITWKKEISTNIAVSSIALIFISWSLFSKGNGLIDETEFLQWIARIQALRETETSAEDDDLTQDLVAAFRLDLISLIESLIL